MNKALESMSTRKGPNSNVDRFILAFANVQTGFTIFALD